MHGMSVLAAAETEQVAAVGDVRPLNSFEQALRAALTDELVSASVVRERARLRVATTSPDLAKLDLVKTMLSRDVPIATTLPALHELERHGFAEWIRIARCVRWRRAREADDLSAASSTSERAAST